MKQKNQNPDWEKLAKQGEKFLCGLLTELMGSTLNNSPAPIPPPVPHRFPTRVVLVQMPRKLGIIRRFLNWLW